MIVDVHHCPAFGSIIARSHLPAAVTFRTSGFLGLASLIGLSGADAGLMANTSFTYAHKLRHTLCFCYFPAILAEVILMSIAIAVESSCF
jgi:hypothetical protein